MRRLPRRESSRPRKQQQKRVDETSQKPLSPLNTWRTSTSSHIRGQSSYDRPFVRVQKDTAASWISRALSKLAGFDGIADPAVRHGDDQWFDIVKWTLFAMINAEELAISQKTLDEALKSTNPEIKRFVGTEGNFGEQLGLTKDWAVRIVKHVGNYGESFERNVGQGSTLKIERGLNKLWNKGGIQYAPPIR